MAETAAIEMIAKTVTIETTAAKMFATAVAVTMSNTTTATITAIVMRYFGSYSYFQC